MREFAALASTRPLNPNPESYRSAAMLTGSEPGTFTASTTGSGISEFCLLAGSLLLSLSGACPEETVEDTPAFAGNAADAKIPELVPLTQLLREDFIQTLTTSKHGNTSQRSLISCALYLDGNGQSKLQGQDLSLSLYPVSLHLFVHL